MGRRKEAALEEGGFVAGIEKLIATKDVGERTLYCFLAGTLRRRPEYAPLGYDRAQLYLSIRTKADSSADAVATVVADVTLNEDDRDDDHLRIIDLSVVAEGIGCGTFAIEVLYLIADWYGCRGIMGELFGNDLVRESDRTLSFFQRRGFDVIRQKDNRVHPWRIQTVSYRDRLPECVEFSLDGVLV